MLPLTAGTAFKPEHFAAMTSGGLRPGFVEVHAENYMGDGGLPHAMLDRLRTDHALSLHGVGLSIGGEEPLDREHLRRLRALCDRFQPQSFSEHLAWSSHGGTYFSDLLPLPYNEAALQRIISHVIQTQDALGRRILLENPATYLGFGASTIPETEFLSEIAAQSGCGLLLDVNNVYVACRNRNENPAEYLWRFPWHRVMQIHLAGHQATTDGDGVALWIDDHGSAVAEDVWSLYEVALRACGPVATLIEWDNDVPDWPLLAAEAARAQAMLDDARRKVA